MTEFQEKVYSAVKLIPTGKVSTYKHLAEHLSCKSFQAIGQALKKNPYAPEVPCHRVIKSDLSIGGYFGAIEGDEITKKISLLKSEGIELDEEGKLLSEAQVFSFS